MAKALAALLLGLAMSAVSAQGVMLAQAAASPAAAAQPQANTDNGPDAVALALNRARELRAARQPEQALDLAEKGLAVAPRDLQLRFLKGLLLSELKRPTQAIAVFEALTQDFPELGEPYNNLAVLLAGRGELEKARELLERALQAQPGYALAWENLGDVQLRLAERAYAEAVSRNPSLRSARGKLDQSREWIKSTESKP